MSEQLGFEKGIFKAYWHMGVARVYSNELEASELLFLKALTSAEKIQLVYDQVVAYRILRNINFTLGEYPEALDFFMKGNELAIEHQFKDIIPEFYHNIGYVYYETKDFERAFEYLELCQQTTKEYEIEDLYPNSLNNMAKIMTYKKEYEEARTYARGILGMVDSIPNAINFLPIAYEHIGHCYYEEKVYDSALFYYNKMLYSLEEMDEMYMGPKRIEEILAYRGIGKSQVALSRFTDAEVSFLKAYALSDEAKNLEDKGEVALALSEVYEKSGKLAKSLEYYRVYKTIS